MHCGGRVGDKQTVLHVGPFLAVIRLTAGLSYTQLLNQRSHWLVAGPFGIKHPAFHRNACK